MPMSTDDESAAGMYAYEYEYEYDESDIDDDKDAEADADLYAGVDGGQGEGEDDEDEDELGEDEDEDEDLRATITLPLDSHPTVDARVSRLGQPEVSKRLVASVDVLDSDDFLAHEEAFDTLKEQPREPPARWPIVLIGLALVVVGLACIVAAVWWLFPYDMPPFDGKFTKQGRDTTWSWVVGAGACAAGVLFFGAALLAFCATARQSVGCARALVWTLAASAGFSAIVLVGMFYVHYSDANLNADFVRTEAGIVAVAAFGIFLFVFLPCVGLARVFARDLSGERDDSISNVSISSRSQSDATCSSRAPSGSADEEADDETERATSCSDYA